MFVGGKIMYPKIIFYSFKIMKICYLFHDSRNMIDASVPVIQIQPLTPRERDRDQFMCSKGPRVTIEILVPPNRTPACLYV